MLRESCGYSLNGNFSFACLVSLLDCKHQWNRKIDGIAVRYEGTRITIGGTGASHLLLLHTARSNTQMQYPEEWHRHRL